MKVYTPGCSDQAPLSSLIDMILDTCKRAALSDVATIAALVQLDAIDSEDWQRCATCFNWTTAGFIYPAVLDGTCHLVTMCSTCVSRCERGVVTDEMITNYTSYIGV